jgi:hypothetical protein
MQSLINEARLLGQLPPRCRPDVLLAMPKEPARQGQRTDIRFGSAFDEKHLQTGFAQRQDHQGDRENDTAQQGAYGSSRSGCTVSQQRKSGLKLRPPTLASEGDHPIRSRG